MQRFSRYNTFALILAIIACAESMPAQTSQFTHMNPLYFTMPVGGPNPLPQDFIITSTGSNFGFGETLTTATGGNWLNSNGTGCGCGTPQMLTVSVNAAALPAGTYTGQLVFTSGTISMTVPVTLAVEGPTAAFFGEFASQLGFVFGGGINPQPPSQAVQITNAGVGPLNWTSAVSTFQGSNWLSVSAQSGTAPSIITVSVATQGLQPGIYTGLLLFQSGNGSVTIPVTLVVGSSTSPVFQQLNAFNFTMPVGGPNPLKQAFTVTSTGSNFGFGEALTTVTGGSWLQSNGTGCGCATPQNLTVSVNGSALPAGTYVGQILFSSGNTLMTVPVTLTVVGSGGTLFGDVVSELDFVFGGGINPVPPPQAIQLTTIGAGTLNWTVTVTMYQGSNWLSVSAQSGTAPSIITVSVATQGLQPGLYTGLLLFQSGNGGVTVPVNLVVGSSTGPVFQQLNGFNFTMPVGGPNPSAQTFTVTSTGSNFGFGEALTTMTGGNWLQSSGTGCGCATPQNLTVSVNGAALSEGIYTGQILFSSGNTLMTVPVTLTVGTPPPIEPALQSGTLANGATYLAGGLVPGSWAQVKGTNLGTTTRIWAASDFTGLGNNLPTNLSGVQVMVNNQPATVYYISPTQVSFQVPAGITGTASVQVIANGQMSNSVTAAAATSSPGIFPVILGGTNYAAAVFNSDGKIAADPSNGPAFRNAVPGDAVQLYATGLAASPAGTLISTTFLSGVTVTIGTITIPASAAALVAVGEFQINFTVPQSFASLPPGLYPISISINGIPSPGSINSSPPGPVVIPIQH
jgi:uncharacterized protein (TIGR03437 family)